MSAKVISVVSLKGGVAKSTSVISIASVLATKRNKKKKQNRILVVDLDSQGNLSDFFLTSSEEPWQLYTIDKVLEDQENVHQYIKKVSFRYYERKTKLHKEFSIDIIPSTDQLSFYEVTDVYALKNLFSVIGEEYDFILLDYGPSHNSVTYLGLAASDYIISPISADSFSAKAVLSTQNIYENALDYNPELRFIGSFFANVDMRYGAEKWIKEQYDNTGGKQFFKAFVRHSSCFADANATLTPVVSITSAYDTGTADYTAVTEEMLNRMRG